VIPFQLRTSNSEDQFLSVALADAVIHRLASTGKLVVRPIASVMRYKGVETEWAQVARDLNVDLVVEGTIQKMGAKARVLVQVHRARDRQTLGSAKHDGDLDDLFGLQDRIADSVSDVLAPREQSGTETATPPTKNPLAYELYLRAVERVAHFNKFDISSGIEMLNRAVELDPGFADAWGQLAQAYSQMGMFFDPDPKWFERGEAAVAKTLELDPVQCDAHHARAQILWSPSRGFQNRPALRAMNAAVRVNPSRYAARQFRGAILFHLGFHKEAERDIREALLANPSFTLGITSMGLIAQYKGDYQAAHDFNEQALALDPSFMHANFWSPLVLILLGRMEDAAARLERVRPMIPGEPQLAAVEGLVAAHEGNFKACRTTGRRSHPGEHQERNSHPPHLARRRRRVCPVREAGQGHVRTAAVREAGPAQPHRVRQRSAPSSVAGSSRLHRASVRAAAGVRSVPAGIRFGR
jgi:TolB-like protein/Tfp pilus assembly protein PilF